MVVGNGNVAIDCARMLALSADELRKTDTADHAIDLLASDAVKEIVILGRRGPVQAAFTNPELLELGELEQADVIVDPADLELDEASQAFLDSDECDKTTRENVRILREYAAREPEGKPKRIVLQFLTSPVELQGDGRVERIVVERNRLEPREDGSLAARPHGRAGDARLRPRAALDRLQGHRDPGGSVRRAPRHDPERRRARRRRRAPRDRRVRHGLDPPRAERRDRHQQEGRPGGGVSLLEDAEAGLLNEPATDGDIAELLTERGVELISGTAGSGSTRTSRSSAPAPARA